MRGDPVARDFAGALERLTADEASGEAGLLNHLSHATPSEVAVWRSAMAELGAERRVELARMLLAAAEADFQVDFTALFRDLLDDALPPVRAAAIDGLWESEDPALADRYLAFLREDLAPEVRARAAAALGAYLRREELGELPEGRMAPALAALLEAAGDEGEDVEVRRRATEAAGFADRADVRWLIERHAASAEPRLVAGALRAMGHSADERWADVVVGWLEADEAELRFEAARAAGELGVGGALRALARLAAEDEAEIRHEAIVAIGEIGGATATRILEALSEEEPDPTLREAIEDALSNAALGEGEIDLFGLGDALDPFLGRLGGDPYGDGDDEDVDEDGREVDEDEPGDEHDGFDDG